MSVLKTQVFYLFSVYSKHIPLLMGKICRPPISFSPVSKENHSTSKFLSRWWETSSAPSIFRPASPQQEAAALKRDRAVGWVLTPMPLSPQSQPPSGPDVAAICDPVKITNSGLSTIINFFISIFNSKTFQKL